MTFWSVQIKGGENQIVDVEQTLGVATYLHITNIALAGMSDGPSVISVVINGKESIIATLSKNTMQYHLDLMIDSSVTIKVSGKVAAHISGYITYASMDDEDEDDDRAFMGGMDDDEDEDEDLDEAEEEEYDEDEEGEEEDEDEDEDEEAPLGVPIATQRPGAASLFDDEAMEEDDEEFDEDEDSELDEDEELNSDDVIGMFDDDEGEGEEEEEIKPVAKKVAAAPLLGKKREAEAVTPVPSSKKSKGEEKKAPASAPAKVQEPKKASEGAKAPPKTPEMPQDAGAYEAALVRYLSSQPGKKASLADAGQAIKRPNGIKSLSKFAGGKKDKFKVGKDDITLL